MYFSFPKNINNNKGGRRPKTGAVGRSVGVSYKGKGDYKQIKETVVSALNSVIPKGTFSRILGGLGGAAGNRFLPGAGGVAGSSIGSYVGDQVARFAGFGDYKQQSRKGGPIRNGNLPNFSGSSLGIRVKHREMFMQVSGSVDFQADRLMINPANATLFPWLSQLADGYEQYIMHGMFFVYEPLSGAINSASAALGDVMMATQYDVFDPTFSTKSEMLNYQFATSVVPCSTGMHAVECSPRETQQRVLKCRHGPVPAGATRQNYDVADFTIATQGQPSVYTCGQLWVVYDVEFLKQKISTGAAARAATLYFGPTCTTAAPFFPTANYAAASNLPMAITPGDTVFTPGLFKVSNTQIRVNVVGYVRVTIRWFSALASLAGLPTIINTSSGMYYQQEGLGNYTAVTDPALCVLTMLLFITGTSGGTLNISGPGGMTDGACVVEAVAYPPSWSPAPIISTPVLYLTTYPLAPPA